MEIVKLIVIVACILFIALLGMAVKVIFHKSHKFPETSAGHNKEMRKKGISCARHDEIKCWGNKQNKGCSTCYEQARD
mgnify:CR=1 FL=1